MYGFIRFKTKELRKDGNRQQGIYKLWKSNKSKTCQGQSKNKNQEK